PERGGGIKGSTGHDGRNTTRLAGQSREPFSLRGRREGQPCLVGKAWALFSVLNLAFASAAGTLRRYSSEAVMSYQPPSPKSTRALLLKLTVTTRPMSGSPLVLAKRFSSGRSRLATTYWSVHSCFRASWRRAA